MRGPRVYRRVTYRVPSDTRVNLPRTKKCTNLGSSAQRRGKGLPQRDCCVKNAAEAPFCVFKNGNLSLQISNRSCNRTHSNSHQAFMSTTNIIFFFIFIISLSIPTHHMGENLTGRERQRGDRELLLILKLSANSRK